MALDPELDRLLTVGVLVFARVLPIAALTPILGAQTPASLRVALALGLTVALVPGALAQAPVMAPDLRLPLLLAKEALLGLLFALCIQILFASFAAIGEVVDVCRGATLANVLDPLTQDQTSVLALLMAQLGLAVFFHSGAATLFLATLGESLVRVPPQQMPAAGALTARGVDLAQMAGVWLGLTVRLAMPVVATVLLLEVVLALLGRVLPQLQVYVLGLGLKCWLGLLVLALVLPGLLRAWERELLPALLQWLGR